MDDDENAPYVAALGHDGAERGVPPCLLRIALSLHNPNRHVLDIRCLPTTRLRDDRRGNIPDFGPSLRQWLPKRLRSDAAQRQTGIIVEGDQLRPPQQI